MADLPVDFLSSEFIANPYPFYDNLRETSPIKYSEDWGLWFFTAYEDIHAILRDHRMGRATLDEPPTVRSVASPFEQLNSLFFMDKEPPDHTRLRGLVSAVFTPRRVEDLRPRIQQVTDSLLDQISNHSTVDLMADFATPLPVTVIAELLGIPENDRKYLQPWSHAIVAMYELSTSEEDIVRANQASRDFSDYLRGLTRFRKQKPGRDLISALAQVELQGDHLTEEELVATCVLLLNAGHEATVNGFGNCLLALIQHPDALATLRKNPEMIKSGVEELLRFDSPLQLFKRWVTQDFDYMGFQFKRGMRFALLYGAGNRDPKRFKDPHQLDLNRKDNAHLTFGGGIHYCLGAPLARLELQISINSLLQRFPNLELEGISPRFRPTFIMRGLETLWVKL